MTRDRTNATFSFPRPEHRGLLLGLRPPQVGIMVTASLGAVAVLKASPSAAGLLGALFLLAGGGAATLARFGGRSLDAWVRPVACFGWRSLAGRRWRSPLPQSGRSSPGVPPPPLLGCTMLRARRGGDEVAVVKDRGAGGYTAALTCRGRGFALLDADEQERLAGAWGDALAAFAQERSPVSRIAWVERARPEVEDALSAHLAEASVVGADDPGHQVYGALLRSAAPATQRHDVLLCLSIDGARARRLIEQAGGGDRGACAVLSRELSVLGDRLHRADIEVRSVVTPDEFAEVLRGAFDPAGARVRERARSRGQQIGSGRSDSGGWPMATEVAWDHYRTDSAFHATYWVAEWPRRDVPVWFLHPLLLRAQVDRAVAVVMEPVPPSRAAKAVEAARASHLADEELRSKAGYLSTARRRKQHEAIAAREVELADGHAEFRFSGYVTVSAPDRAALDEGTAEIEQLAIDAQLELRRLYGEQDIAFTYTLPLGRGLA